MKIKCPKCDNITEIDKETICPNCNPNCNHSPKDRCGCYVMFPEWFKNSQFEIK